MPDELDAKAKEALKVLRSLIIKTGLSEMVQGNDEMVEEIYQLGFDDERFSMTNDYMVEPVFRLSRRLSRLLLYLSRSHLSRSSSLERKSLLNLWLSKSKAESQLKSTRM